MHTYSRTPSVAHPSPIDVRVEGPDTNISAGDLRHLFPGSALTQARLDRLNTWPRVVVSVDGRTVAVATCQKTELELRVPEIGIETEGTCADTEVVHALLDALELAGLAANCRRLVLIPPKVCPSVFQKRGYRTISERCAGAWLEKELG